MSEREAMTTVISIDFEGGAEYSPDDIFGHVPTHLSAQDVADALQQNPSLISDIDLLGRIRLMVAVKSSTGACSYADVTL